MSKIIKQIKENISRITESAINEEKAGNVEKARKLFAEAEKLNEYAYNLYCGCWESKEASKMTLFLCKLLLFFPQKYYLHTFSL